MLTDEPCTLKAVENLKHRSVWHEKGKRFEGCWAPHPGVGLVVSYWSDKTVAIIPIDAFVKVTGI